jgi:ubiquinone/menaquinone biosynthesis C-methylase UbiE
VAERSHPVFARLYVRAAASAERAGTPEHRRELLNGLSGRVIEVGAGHGLNFAHYPLQVEEVLAVEPDRYLRERSTNAAARAAVPIRVVSGLAERLPADDDTFDAAVASLVLCSVADQGRALAELRRVLRRGGELRFYEHVRAREPRLARWQKALDRWLWPRVAGGCHCARDTPAAIMAAGFEIERCRRFPFRPCAVACHVAPHVIGAARSP